MAKTWKEICCTGQGILKGDVSLYHWSPVWRVWNQLYDNWQFLFLFAKQTIPNQSNRRSTVKRYFPFSIPCTGPFSPAPSLLMSPCPRCSSQSGRWQGVPGPPELVLRRRPLVGHDGQARLPAQRSGVAVYKTFFGEIYEITGVLR